MKILKNKQGQIENYLAVIIFLFGFGLITLIAALIYSRFLTEATTAGLPANALAVGNTFLSAILFFDWVSIIILVVLIIGVGITSYKLNTAPIFFIVTVFMASLLGAISWFFNYMFIQIVSDAAFVTVITLFPKTMIICTNFHWIALICLVVGSITLFAKKERGGFVGE